MVEYKKDYIPKGKIRPGTKMIPASITIHSTGNPNSTAKNERGWLTNPDNDRIASWHICVDENEAIEAIPLNEVAYHSGTREGNTKSISVEICESGNREKTIENAVQLVAGMLRERSWGVDKLKRHYDWSGKVCPRIFQPNNWAGWVKFKQGVQKELAGGEIMTDKNQPSPWAKEAWEWAKKEGLIDGTRPKDTLTREEFAIVLKRATEKNS